MKCKNRIGYILQCAVVLAFLAVHLMSCSREKDEKVPVGTPSSTEQFDIFKGEIAEVYIPARNKAIYFFKQMKSEEDRSSGGLASFPIEWIAIELKEFPNKVFYLSAGVAKEQGFLIDHSSEDEWVLITTGQGTKVELRTQKGETEIVSINRIATGDMTKPQDDAK